MDRLIEFFIQFFSRTKFGFVWLGLLLMMAAAFAVWSTLPNDSKTRYLNSLESIFSSKEIADVQVASFKVSDTGNDYAVWLKAKLERKLVEFYVEKGIKVLHPLTADHSFDRAKYTISGAIQTNGNDTTTLVVDVVNSEGFTIGTTSFDQPTEFYTTTYKDLPEAIWYKLALDPSTLAPVSSNLATKFPAAYTYYLNAKRSVTANELEAAEIKLQLAVQIDPGFAMAYWALGELNKMQDKNTAAEEYYTKAAMLNADHPRLPITSRMPVPLPSVLQEVQRINWQEIDNGLYLKSVAIADYSINISAIKFNSNAFAIRVVPQIETNGNIATDFLNAVSGAIAVVNGGFFEVDQNNRLSPSGILVVDGQQRNGYHQRGGSGFLYDTGTSIKIDWSKHADQIRDVKYAVQSGPMVVDPGGKNGILSDDHDQRRRSAFCLNENTATIIVVDGPLSLYEFGELLSTRELQGGFDCERAINLDGGPSSQFHFSYKGHELDVPGTWRVNNAVVLVARNN